MKMKIKMLQMCLCTKDWMADIWYMWKSAYLMWYKEIGIYFIIITTPCSILNIVCLLIIQVPWDDLRYLFGEIMYGGHITDDWDRRLCRTYLTEYMKPELVGAFVYQCNVNQQMNVERDTFILL